MFLFAVLIVGGAPGRGGVLVWGGVPILCGQFLVPGWNMLGRGGFESPLSAVVLMRDPCCVKIVEPVYGTF